MKPQLNILLLEFAPKWGDKMTNLAFLEEKMAHLPDGVDIIMLPEMFSTGFITADNNEINHLAEKNTDNTISLLQKLADKYSTAITGTFLARTVTKFYNRAFFIAPGDDPVFYDKHHLFSIGGEADNYTPGWYQPPIIRYRGWNILPIVCYEIRFPEWCRNTSARYDLMLVYANWPKSRQFAWEHLLIARALENQCYVAAINRTGTTPDGLEYPTGSSMVLDAKGKNISISYNEMLLASLDYEKLSVFRKKFPVLDDATDFSLNIDSN